MKISTNPPDPVLLGYFIDFSLSGDPQFKVDLESKTYCRVCAHVSLPDSMQENWLAGFNAVIRRLQVGRRFPIRLNYENAIQFFTIEQLQSLEKTNPTLSFYLYEAPERIAVPVTSSQLDIDAICRSAKRHMYAEERRQRQLEREAVATVRT